jgi:hypothetical protein
MNEDMAETRIFFLDSVTTSGQTVLPVKTRHIIFYAHGLSLQDTKKQNDFTTSRNEDIAEKPVLSYLPLAAKR